MNKELEECELLDIAEHIEPDALLRLAIRLSFSITEYQKMKRQEDDLAYMILYKWRENRVEGPQNRKELVGVLFDLKKVRLAEMVASKNYHTRSSGPHQLSQSRWEMGTTTSDLDSAVKGTSTIQTAGMATIDHRGSSIAYTDSYTWI